MDQRDESIRKLMERAGACLRAGDQDGAARLCRRVLDQDPDQAEALGFLGILEGMAGRPEAALAYLRRASELRPGNPALINSLALACLKTGNLSEAERQLQGCLRRHPAFAPAWYTLGVVKRQQGDTHAALTAYERLLTLDPSHAEAWANLGRLRERLNQLRAASEAVERSLAIDPGNVMARLTAAQIEARQGSHASARKRLEQLLETGDLSTTNEIIARSRLGDALDALDEPAQAFAQFEKANQLQAAMSRGSAGEGDGPYSMASVSRMKSLLGEIRSAACPSAADAGSGPFFLMGFPRSGTTLLDRMLTAHDSVVSIEEQETLTDAHRDFVMAPGGLERLRTLSNEERQSYVDAYRRRVADALGSTAPVVLDKLPLHTISLPLIARLFPQASVIFAVRDPRDVCLSCFMQRFEPNTAMNHFLDLNTTASYYVAVMELGLDSLEELPIRACMVRYEDLVTDPRRVLRKVVSFLNLDWDASVLDYRERIEGSVIDTPSYRQVAQPLYRSSMGRWRRYTKELGPVLPMLEPVAKRLGYD